MASTAPSRRRFLNLCTSLLLAVLGLLVAIPAVAYVVAPLRRRRGDGAGAPMLDLGPLADLPPGQWHLRTVEVPRAGGWTRPQGRQGARVRHAVWVRRGRGDRDVTILSSTCPHLGCPVNWRPDPAQFFCPCHGGIFDADGRPVAGPPPCAMDPVDFEVRAGRLWLRWQEFRSGGAERVPVRT